VVSPRPNTRAGEEEGASARAIFLSPETIVWHLRRVYPKFGISSWRELIPMPDRL
jgi:DNA-binding CsgD family transcriptional regulator